MNIDMLLEQYARTPDTLTITPRQARKFTKRLALIDEDPDVAVRRALELGHARAKVAPPTVQLISIGSSGSHWLQSMLSGAGDLMGCGEVYFPDPVLQQLETCTGDTRAFIQAVYAVNGSGAQDPERLMARAINTAHKPDPLRLQPADGPMMSVFLKRDPLDVAISRTFRKSEYRGYLGQAETSDEEYFNHNLKRVRTFYRQAARYEYDLVIAYEDLRTQGPQQIMRIFDALDMSPTPERIATVIAQIEAARTPHSPTPGEGATGPDDDMRARAQHYLGEVRSAWGYT